MPDAPNIWPTRTEYCVGCGHQLDAVAGRDGRSPGPGSVSICIGCGHVAMFDAQLRRREPTAAENFALRADRELQAILARLAKSNQQA